LGLSFPESPAKVSWGASISGCESQIKKKQSTSITSDPSPCTAIQQTTNPNPIAASTTTTTLH